MKNQHLSSAHAFARWHGTPLTALQEQIIDALEQQRVRTGSVRAVINVTDRTAPELEHLLLRYTHYVHDCYSPRAHIMVVDSTRRAAAARYGHNLRNVRDHVYVSSGSRAYRTRGLNFSHMLAYRMDRYGISIRGDPRTADVIDNAVATIDFRTRGSSIIFLGHYRKRSRRAFARYYARHLRLGADAPFLVVDSLCPPVLRRIRAISRTEWRRRARLPIRAPAGVPTAAPAAGAEAQGGTPTARKCAAMAHERQPGALLDLAFAV